VGLFTNLFNNKSSAYKKFEKLFGKVLQKQVSKRDADERNAFLTRDLLRNREKITGKGKKDLVLDFGKKGHKVKYTLAELNRMARSAKKVEDKFETKTAGVPVLQLLGASDKKDIMRAHAEIRTAVLYKIHGNMLHFRVSASDDSDFTHHQVKIRLEEWDQQLRGLDAGSYQQSARGAATGRISFNCDCGRHRYWYRYLATIGGFGLDPEEHVFPKIRNPGLKGCCCKHVIKTLATLRMSQVHNRIAKEMEDQGKKKGFFTKVFKGEAPQEKFLSENDLSTAEKAGTDSSVTEMQKEYRKYKAAQKGFNKKMSDPATKKALNNLKTQRDTYREVAKAEKAKADQLSKDKMISDMQAAMALSVYRDKLPLKAAIEKFASDRKIPLKEAKEMAKQVNI